MPLCRVILAQGMPFPFIGHYDPAKIGMAFKSNAEKIEILSLVPVSGRPDREDRLNNRIISRKLYFQPQPERQID